MFPIRIGNHQNGSLGWYGGINDLRIYNTALSGTDITALYNGSNPSDVSGNLLAWYKMNSTSGATAYNSSPTQNINGYAKTFGDAYSSTVLTPGGKLYAGNTTESSLDRYDAVQNDTADQYGSTDLTYTTASTPALRNGTINDIKVTEGNSIADNASNEVALGTNTGTELINERTTLSSAQIRHYTKTGTVGSSNWSNRQFGDAIEFSAANTTDISIPYSTTDNPTSTMTFEAWIRPTSTSISQAITQIAGVRESGNSWQFGMGSGKLYFGAWQSNGTYHEIDGGIGDAALTANTWYHVAAVADGTTLRMFVNGQAYGPTASYDGTFATNTVGRRFLGKAGSNDTGRYFDGLMSEVRLSNSARYTSNFVPSSTPFTSDANTDFLFHFNERTGMTVADNSPNANNGTLNTNCSTYPLRVIPALAGSADVVTAVGFNKTSDTGQDVQYDGSSQYASFAGGGGVNNLSASTISLWVKWNGTQNSNFFSQDGVVMARQHDGVYTDQLIALNGTDPSTAHLRLQFTGCSGLTAGSTAVGNGVWRNVVVTLASGRGVVYLNGAQDASTSPVLARHITIPVQP